MQFYTYDIETISNFFSFVGKFRGNDQVHVFEISTRKNMRTELLTHLSYIQNTGAHMVGYNNLGFDWPIVQKLMLSPHTFDHNTAKEMCDKIFAQSYGFNNLSIQKKDRLIPQIDLLKLNHFDNAAKRTSLKSLQFAMRSESVEDLPYTSESVLTPEQMDEMISYNIHDVTETEKFLGHCIPLIEKRQELLDNQVLYGDVLNMSDVKLGEKYLVNKIGRSKCYNGSKAIQTPRQFVRFSEIILPKIKYETETFNKVLERYKTQIYDCVNTKKNSNIKQSAKLGSLDFHLGVGGVHASVESKYFESDEKHVIKDVDVSGMYPAVAIANGFYPEHLGEDFITHYKQLQLDRKQYPKGTTMNAVLKLAGNGVYGNSNNPYSCFYDPKYTFSVTINGQLQLCQLAEALHLLPGLEIIQANTDGVTVKMRRDDEPFFNLWCRRWEAETGLALEEVEYNRMWIRDVNNYMAETVDGKVKRKGAYWYPETDADYEGWWNKDFSMLAVQKGVDLCHRFGYKPEDVVHVMTDPFDFMLRYKTPGGSTVYIGDEPQTKTVRYYVSIRGGKMIKKSPPKGPAGDFKRKNSLSDEYYNKIRAEIGSGVWDERIHTKNKSKYTERVMSIQSGQLVKQCNRASDFDWGDVDYNFYIEQIKKLIIGDSNVQSK